MTQHHIVVKPKLLPASVPWMISPSAPYLSVQPARAGSSATAIFIGYFRLDDTGVTTTSGSIAQYVPQPPRFVPTPITVPAPYRLVRITFQGAKYTRICPAVSDQQIFSEEQYDWSAIPGARIPGESIEETVRRRKIWWLETGLAPDSRVYEVSNSPWIAELEGDSIGCRHYILSGNDEYVEIVAKGWSWEPGQPVT